MYKTLAVRNEAFVIHATTRIKKTPSRTSHLGCSMASLQEELTSHYEGTACALSKLDLGSRLGASIGLEVVLLLEAAELGDEVAREGNDEFIEAAGFLVELATGCRDTVLGAFELAHEFLEISVGLEVGIALGDSYEAAKGLTEFTLCLLVFSNLLRGCIGGVDGHLRGLGACIDDGLKGALLVSSITLDGVDKVRDEVAAALILGLNVAPGLFDVLLAGDDGVVLSDAPKGDNGNDDADDNGCS